MMRGGVLSRRTQRTAAGPVAATRAVSVTYVMCLLG
jgi:hypothetical protein